MGFEERNTLAGTGIGLVAMLAYWLVIAWRAATDNLPFADVAWQGPMLTVVLIGGGVYGLAYGIARWRARGKRISDERDATIAGYAEQAGGGLVSMAVIATLVMLALDAPTFWVAHVLFMGSYFGSLASAGLTLAAYREGFQS